MKQQSDGSRTDGRNRFKHNNHENSFIIHLEHSFLPVKRLLFKRNHGSRKPRKSLFLLCSKPTMQSHILVALLLVGMAYAAPLGDNQPRPAVLTPGLEVIKNPLEGTLQQDTAIITSDTAPRNVSETVNANGDGPIVAEPVVESDKDVEVDSTEGSGSVSDESSVETGIETSVETTESTVDASDVTSTVTSDETLVETTPEPSKESSSESSSEESAEKTSNEEDEHNEVTQRIEDLVRFVEDILQYFDNRLEYQDRMFERFSGEIRTVVMHLAKQFGKLQNYVVNRPRVHPNHFQYPEDILTLPNGFEY
uniref:Uncharacterized protein n=1 Tax=Panagrellus redivivus TaxID=6233 RepID=A0A7E4VET7_PANRE